MLPQIYNDPPHSTSSILGLQAHTNRVTMEENNFKILLMSLLKKKKKVPTCDT